jgi:hypothetical protein
MVKMFKYSDFTAITSAFLRRFRELTWDEVGLFSLALICGRSVVVQEGSTRDSGTVADTFSLGQPDRVPEFLKQDSSAA